MSHFFKSSFPSHFHPKLTLPLTLQEQLFWACSCWILGCMLLFEQVSLQNLSSTFQKQFSSLKFSPTLSFPGNGGRCCPPLHSQGDHHGYWAGGAGNGTGGCWWYWWLVGWCWCWWLLLRMKRLKSWILVWTTARPHDLARSWNSGEVLSKATTIFFACIRRPKLKTQNQVTNTER